MNHLYFWAVFHLKPFATPCNAPSSRKSCTAIFRVFDFLRDKGPLNKKSRKDESPAFLGVLSLSTVCNAVHVTVFSEMVLCHFSGFFLCFRSFDGILRVIFITSVVELTYNPVFYAYSSTLQIVLYWMLANLTDIHLCLFCDHSGLLGWVCSTGLFSVSPHRISTLATCDCELLRTVKNLRSFIGTYKVLSRVIHGTATLLFPLDTTCAGREPAEII